MIIENNSLEVLRTCDYIKNDKLGAMVSNNLYLSIVATNSCQCDCPYCINSLTDRTLQLPFEKAKVNIKKSVDEFGIKEAVILGGEPTLYPHLFDLIKFLKNDCGLRKVGFTTNGIKLKDVAYLGNVVETGVDFINISYHNHYDFLLPSDMWDIYTRFCNIRKPHQKIRINTNVWKGNHDTIESLLKFIGQISILCDEIRISNIIRKDSFSVNPNAVDEAESMYMTDEEYEVLFNQLLDTYEPNYSIIHNPAALGFVNYYLIPTKVPIILNWNIDSKVSEQVCENNFGDNKIHTIKCLVTGDMSLSWNVNNIIDIKNENTYQNNKG